MSEHVHQAGCGCMANFSLRLSRRGALGLGIAGAVTSAFPALAVDKTEAMLVNCIDPRFTTTNWSYMASQGYKDIYSHFVIAGGPVGVVAPTFLPWQRTFWDNLLMSVQVHGIRRVVGITHRDCAAAAVVFGDAIKKDRNLETTRHVESLRAFRALITRYEPKLAVHTGIMAVDGGVEAVT